MASRGASWRAVEGGGRTFVRILTKVASDILRCGSAFWRAGLQTAGINPAARKRINARVPEERFAERITYTIGVPQKSRMARDRGLECKPPG